MSALHKPSATIESLEAARTRKWFRENWTQSLGEGTRGPLRLVEPCEPHPDTRAGEFTDGA